MFSGPDFIYANAFYPKAKTYVLSGLEQVGAVPDITTLRGALAPDLSALRNSLRWLLQHSYFITSQMGSDLHRGRINGTLPVLYVFLARSGHTIREVTPVRLDENGAEQPEARAPPPDPGPRRQDRVRRQRRRAAHALLLQHRSFQRGRRQQQVPGFLPDPGAGDGL